MVVSATGVVTWTPTQADVGRHTATLRVSDPGAHAAIQSIVVVVAAVNDAPRIASHSPTKGSGPLVVPPLLPVQFFVTASDEEGDSLAYAWKVNSSVQANASGPSLALTLSATKLDTVEVLVWDAADTTAFSWVIDARSIPRLSLDTSAVDFGQVALGDTGRVVRVVRNPGSGSLQISELQIGDLAFSALFAASAVAAGDSTRLELRFIPAAIAPKQSTIRFSTNDPSQPSVQVQVSGAGVEVQGPSGDFDGNGVVDFDDFFLFADHFGTQDPVYDLNHSGLVDFDDFFLFADQFGVGTAAALKRVRPAQRPANQPPARIP
jgi:hypothetical protein